MKRAPRQLLWVGVALLVAGAALANPRPPNGWDPNEWAEANSDDESTRVRSLDVMDAWMRRRVGRFKVEGFIITLQTGEATGVSGLADCVAIGDGPGVECVTGLDMGIDQGEDLRTGGREPSIALYGRDPIELKIHFLNVNARGIVEAGVGILKGNTLRHRNRIANTNAIPVRERVTWTYAPPDSDEIHITSDTETNYEAMVRLDMFLTRITPEEEGEGKQTDEAPAER